MAESFSLWCVNAGPAPSVSMWWGTEFPQHPQRKHYFLKGKPQWKLMVTSRGSQATVMQAIKNVKNASAKIRHWNSLNQV